MQFAFHLPGVILFANAILCAFLAERRLCIREVNLAAGSLAFYCFHWRFGRLLPPWRMAALISPSSTPLRNCLIWGLVLHQPCCWRFVLEYSRNSKWAGQAKPAVALDFPGYFNRHGFYE